MADERHLLTDLKLELRHHQLRPVYTVATTTQRLVTKEGLHTVADMALLSGSANLGQAVLMRLLTPRGELTELAHPEYGSRLFELIGRQNTETTRNLVRLHILEALQQEQRVARVVTLTVEPDGFSRDRVNVLLRVQPTGETPEVTIGPFTLEFEP